MDCLATGVGTAEMYMECPECMVPEGLAPTFRSGMPPPHLGGNGHSQPAREVEEQWTASLPVTEDLGYWWAHDKSGERALLGNPKPCGQGTCNPADWAGKWGANISLFNTHWSKLGVYRSGGAIGFSGDHGSHGVVPHYEDLSSARCDFNGKVLIPY